MCKIGSRQTMLMSSQLIIILLTILWTIDHRLTYAQSAKLKVSGDVTAQSIILDPQDLGTFPCDSSHEGQIAYNSNDEQLYYCDSAKWNTFGGSSGNATVATRIVAAYNSLGSTQDGTPTGDPCLGDGSACNNPKADYTCDGTDDQQMINRAINDLPAGGTVYLLEGTYNISSALLEGETLTGVVPHSNTSIIGAGRGTVLYNFSPAFGAGDADLINAKDVNGILISQLNLNHGQYGIKFSNVSDSRIDKIWTENAVYSAVDFYQSTKNTISNSHISSALTTISFSSSSNNIIYNNILRPGYYAVEFSGSSNNSVTGNEIVTCYTCIGVTNYSNNNIISGNYISNGGSINIEVRQNSQNNIISKNILVNCGIGAGGEDCISVSSSSYNSIYGNRIQSSSHNGINLKYGARANSVCSNLISDTQKNGIRVEGSGAAESGDFNLISSNYIYNFDASNSGLYYGIDIPKGAYWQACSFYNYLVGNEIKPVTRSINDRGSYTSSTGLSKITLEIGDRYMPQNPCAPDQTLDTPCTSHITVSYGVNCVLSDVNAISDGNYAGKLLIITNVGVGTITIPDNANTQLRGNTAKNLASFEIITFIWNGTDWIQTGGKE